MTIKGKRIFNYRPLCVFAVLLVIGIILGEALYGEHVAFIITTCLATALAFVLLACFKRVRKFLYLPLAVLIGLIGITTSNAVYDANSISEFRGKFSATVSSEIIIDSESTAFYVTDVRVDGKKLKYDAYVYIARETNPDFNAGDVVLLDGYISSNKHSKFNTYYGSNRANGRGYFAYVYTAQKQSEGDAPFPLNFQLAIKRALFENNDEATAYICQALILGDKRGFDEGLYSDIATSGLAHVLAVSGLHISLLAGLVFFLLRKLKLNPKIAFVVVLVLTFLYSMLCSFTASSLRAVIMCGVMMFSSAFGKKRDNLSALSLAAILILIFRPTALLEVGFLLSFYSVLGILLFYKPFKRLGMRAVDKISPKRQIGKRFVDVCAVSFATNLMTLPLVARFFGRIPTLFVLSNFFVLPYIMFVYILLIIFTLLTLITTFGGFVWLMKFLLIPFRMYVSAIGGLPLSTIPMSASVAGIVCFSLIILFVSRFVFVKRHTKVIGTTVAASASLVVCLLFALV